MNWLLFAVLSAIAFALYNVFIKLAALKVNPIVGTFALQLAAALLGLLAYSILKFGGKEIMITSTGLTYAIVAGIFVGVAEILFFMMFTKGVDLSIGLSLVTAGSVLIAAIIGILFLGESISTIKIAGAIFAILGVVLLAY